jgi:hypothetical protein
MIATSHFYLYLQIEVEAQLNPVTLVHDMNVLTGEKY